MVAAAEIPRPGVEVVQEFSSASPTIVTPTLVPCNVAPFFEVIEVLDSDGTLNSDAQLEDPYEQLELTIPQSSFPSPRENIDEVDVLEDSIRVFFNFGGSLVEVSDTQAFLTSFLDPDYASQPYVRGNTTPRTVPTDAQGETNYDSSPTTEGSFVGGTGHANSDVITMSDGSTVTVDNQTAGVVDQFTVDSSASTGAVSGQTLIQTGSTGGGIGFTLTLGDSNITTNDVSGAEPVAGYDVDGRTLILFFDKHTSLSDSEFVAKTNMPTSENVTITFAAPTPGGNLTLDEVVEQINAVIPNVASKYASAGGDVLQLTSVKWGAKASAVVRGQGTANGGANRLGFDVTYDTLAVGSGFYAADDSDNDVTSPRLKVYGGSQQVTNDSFPGTPQTANTSPFVDANIQAGDTLVADGVDIGDVAEVESDQLTMELEQTLISQDAAFAPRRVWVQANNLVYPAPAASEEAILTGSVQTSPATQAYVVSDTAPEAGGAGTVGVGPAESLDVNVTVGGVANPTFTVSSGTGWSTTQDIVDGINNSPDVTFEAYLANEFGEEVTTGYYATNPTTTYLGLRTKADNTGSGAGLTVVSSTVAAEIGFTTLPKGDVGENIRFRDGTVAAMTTTAPLASLAGTETISYQVTRGGITLAAETFTLGIAANLDAAVAEWNNNARHTEAYKSTSAGVESSTGTYLSVRTRGENYGGPSVCEIDLTTDGGTLFGVAVYQGLLTEVSSKNFKWGTDRNPKQHDVTFVADEDDGGVSLQQVLDKINAETPNIAAADSTSPPYLVLESNKVGEASRIDVYDGSANAGLGFSDDTNDVGNGRPAPDMAVDVSGDVILQSQLLFDGLTGIPFDPGSAPILISYKGLRIDLSPDADDPSLLVFEDTDQVETVAPPVSTDNPGSLMTFLSLLNAPSVSCAAIGVPEVSDDAPDGTPAGYAKCATFLESEEVYALATASQNPVVHQNFMTHTNSMSEPEQKGERIYFFNPVVPDRANDTLVASGTDANSTPNENEVTVEVNLAPALIDLGIDPNDDINPTSGAIENEVYLDIGGDAKKYLIQKVTNGTTVKLRTSFSSGDGNDDSFYSSDVFPTGTISDDWTVFERGDELLIPGTSDPDKDRIAEAVAGAARAYGFRRGFYTFPDQVGINVTGLEQLVEGYYATACIAGMVGEQPPQQGFTNFPITGLTQVKGSDDFFTESQLNQIAGGGVYTLVQDAEGAPVTCRHQLSTNASTLETRELSITKVVDYTAKFMRAGLRNFIGRTNITQPFIDQLSTIVSGQLDFLVENSVLIGADINNIIQDADNPDTILIDVTLDVPYPCNYIRLTLVI
jgi:hypothetical protein